MSSLPKIDKGIHSEGDGPGKSLTVISEVSAHQGGDLEVMPPTQLEGHLVERFESSVFLKGTNDTTIAEAFIQRHGEHVIYDIANKQWRVFSSGTWNDAEEAEKMVNAYYNKVVVDLIKMIPMMGDFVATEIIGKWLNKSMNRSTINSVLKIVQSKLALGITKLDSNPDLIGMKDMVYGISTGTARPAEGKDYVCKSVGTHFDPLKACPEWEKFLNTVMQGDAEMIDYLRRLTGYFLTASNNEQQVFFFYGIGANGKSTFLDLIKALLGEYSVKIVSDAIMQNKWGERSNGTLANLANLAGARLAITDEMNDSNAVFDTQTLKSISGDDEITARRLYHNPITFKSTAKIVMYGNDKPYGNINDEGFWRRLRFIHFGYVVPPDQRDNDLLTKLKTELPGILNWALQGLAEWKKQGLNAPQKVMDDSIEYRKELDTVTEFLDTNVIEDSGSRVATKLLYEAYVKWCMDNLKSQESSQSFSRKTKQFFEQNKSVSAYKTNKSRGYKGVKLT